MSYLSWFIASFCQEIHKKWQISFRLSWKYFMCFVLAVYLSSVHRNFNHLLCYLWVIWFCSCCFYLSLVYSDFYHLLQGFCLFIFLLLIWSLFTMLIFCSLFKAAISNHPSHLHLNYIHALVIVSNKLSHCMKTLCNIISISYL